ncbi:hypothetical protein C8F04DRAFT_1188417 [Mycena alexandri]|uniref:Uncharacterized protein n=1 Tax=Mycena alexandri TaxID=1745969 RepID=A0AAD6SKW6_9AGAR|nr:hypothetical protein C8F04DRAFT_1188417 [Mycena alexandri]
MAQTDGGWCTVSVHDVGADMLGRVLSAHDGGADGWASGACARRRRRQWLGERCLRKMVAQTRDSADWCLRERRRRHMCSSQYRASPPYTAVSPSRAFVFSTADSRMTMDLPSVSYLMQLGVSRCIKRISPLHHHDHGHRRRIGNLFCEVEDRANLIWRMCDSFPLRSDHDELGGDRLRETMAQTVGARYLRTTGAQTGEVNGACARWRRRHAIQRTGACARGGADMYIVNGTHWNPLSSFEVPTVLHCSVSTLCGFALQMPSTGFALVEVVPLAVSDVRDGGSSVPAYDGGADRGGEWCLRKTAAQAGEANGVCARWRRRHTWLGERCLRKMAAQARDSADWCLRERWRRHHPRRTPGYTVHQLIWPNCSSGSRTFPSCTGSSPFRTLETVGAQYLRTTGAQTGEVNGACARRRRRLGRRTVSAQDGGAGTHGWANGACARWRRGHAIQRTGACARGGADICVPHGTAHLLRTPLARRFGRSLTAKSHMSKICVPHGIAHLLRTPLARRFGRSSSPDREVPHVKNMCSSQFRASPPCTASSSSRAFVPAQLTAGHASKSSIYTPQVLPSLYDLETQGRTGWGLSMT